MTRNGEQIGLEVVAARRRWVAPQLQFRGVVGDILRGGGGKYSITAADSGESRCEKPHANQCQAAQAR